MGLDVLNSVQQKVRGSALFWCGGCDPPARARARPLRIRSLAPTRPGSQVPTADRVPAASRNLFRRTKVSYAHDGIGRLTDPVRARARRARGIPDVATQRAKRGGLMLCLR